MTSSGSTPDPPIKLLMNVIYYECHITIDPFENEDQRKFVADLIAPNGFRVAKLIMEKNGPESTEDAFMSARDISFVDLNYRANIVVDDLRRYGINVRRCKIEGIIRDERY